MARKTAARGRPKGTGVDDAARLAAISELLIANPDMKPTTAIKALGITDASTIRRLRDKHHQLAGSPATAAPAVRDAQHHNVVPLKSHTAAVRKEAPARRTPRTPAPARPVERQAANDQSADAPPAPAASAATAAHPDLVTALFAASVSAAQVAIQLHYKTMSLAFAASPLACMVRSQEFMRLMSAAYLATPADSRSSRPSTPK